MATMVQQAVSVEGTEAEFLQAVMDFFVNQGFDISCEDTEGNPTTAATQYIDTTATATIIFNMGNNVKFKLQRNAVNSSVTSAFLFSGVYPSGSGRNITFCASNNLPSTVVTRTLNFNIIKSTNFVAIQFSAYNSSPVGSVFVAQIKNGSDIYSTGFTNTSNILYNSTYYGETENIIAPRLLVYNAGAGHIDFIDHMPFMYLGTKLFDFSEIYACSNVTAFSSSIALPDGRNFYPIDQNAMIEVDPTS